MKKINNYLALLLMAVAVACEQPGPETPSNPTPEPIPEPVPELTPAELSSPSNGLELDLDNYQTTTFSWTEGTWTGEGIVTYDLSFVKEGADKNLPLASYSVVVPGQTSRDFTFDEVKALFTKARKDESQKEVNLEWFVRTTAGDTSATSSEARKIVIKMSPDPVAFAAGNDILIDGDGALDKGAKMSYLSKMDYATDGNYSDFRNEEKFDYEIFTKLDTAAFYFWSGTTTGDKDWIFCISDDKKSGVWRAAKTATPTFKVEKAGVYRIRINSATGAVQLALLTDMTVRVFANANYDVKLDYVGNGVWKKQNYVIKFGGTNPANIKYKFIVTFEVLASDKPSLTQPYGINDASKTVGATLEDTAKEYFYAHPVTTGNAAGLWSFPASLIDKNNNGKYKADLTFCLNSEKGYYYHEFTNVHE